MFLVGSKQVNSKITDSKQLVIGLDFGAAFSKVVIGDNRVKYAVPFGDFAHPDNQYLLPSLLKIDSKGHCSLSAADGLADSRLNYRTDNLKFPLLDNLYTIDELVRISAFLALVFRATTGWLLQRYAKRYSRSELNWSINAGLPIDAAGNIDGEARLSDLYKQLIHTAWAISVLPGPITLNRVRQYMDADENTFSAFPAVYRSRIITKNQISTFPSCCAQICGYVHSAQCSDDLHMLIDVGAGSMSIVTFKVDKTDIKQCALYACEVESIGARYLLKRRYENLKISERGIDLYRDIPDTHSFSLAHGLTDKDIMFADTMYSGVAARLINKVLDATKIQYCPDSKCWEEGVPTFTYGGGARLEIVQNIIHSHENKKPPHKIKSIIMTPPDDLLAENLSESSYDRLSVAYGLSFAAGEIGRANTGSGEHSSKRLTGV